MLLIVAKCKWSNAISDKNCSHKTSKYIYLIWSLKKTIISRGRGMIFTFVGADLLNKSPILGVLSWPICHKWAKVNIFHIMKCCITFWNWWISYSVIGSNNHISLKNVMKRSKNLWLFSIDREIYVWLFRTVKLNF